MSGQKQSLSDIEILEALDLRDNDGLTMAQIGARLNKTKNAMIGLLSRVSKETEAYDYDGNQNGTLERKWWVR